MRADGVNPLCVVYGADRAFRVACDARLRAAGIRVRLASLPAELHKALRHGDVAMLLVDQPPGDLQDARSVAPVPAGALSPVLMQRAPGESIEGIVARALECVQRNAVE